MSSFSVDLFYHKLEKIGVRKIYLLTALMIFRARQRIFYMLKIFVNGKGRDYEG